jgi:hypothetical protein
MNGLLHELLSIMRGDRRAGPPPVRPLPPTAVAAQHSAVPTAYRSLHKYLDQRYATTVVLTFRQIEDLLGFALPDVARRQQEWWADDTHGDSKPSPQSHSWTQASRTAIPNLPAGIVTFERMP